MYKTIEENKQSTAKSSPKNVYLHGSNLQLAMLLNSKKFKVSLKNIDYTQYAKKHVVQIELNAISLVRQPSY